jgi:3-oxoacyl-[acyl-carrier-protein] synthase-3
MSNVNVGIVGIGTYLPSKIMTAKEISDATNGVWSEDAVRNKLGINQKPVPGDDDGTQEMGARAAKKCLENCGIDPKDIDVILCIGEECW